MNPEVLVFSTRGGTSFDRHNLLNRQLKPTCKKLGFAGVNWHWLGQANATLLDAVGTPLGTVQSLLGHSSSEIAREIYLHSIPSDAGVSSHPKALFAGSSSDLKPCDGVENAIVSKRRE